MGKTLAEQSEEDKLLK